MYFNRFEIGEDDFLDPSYENLDSVHPGEKVVMKKKINGLTSEKLKRVGDICLKMQLIEYLVINYPQMLNQAEKETRINLDLMNREMLNALDKIIN